MKYTQDEAFKMCLLLETKSVSEASKEMGLTWAQGKYLMQAFELSVSGCRVGRSAVHSKLNDDDKEYIYTLYHSGMLQADIADKFEISTTTVSRVIAKYRKYLVDQFGIEDKRLIYCLYLTGVDLIDIGEKFESNASIIKDVIACYKKLLESRRVEVGFLSYQEAQEIMGYMNVTRMKDYHAKRHLHPGLPSSPEVIYAKEWEGANAFLRTSRKNENLLSFSEAKKLVGKESITTCYQYYSNYSKFKGLPFHPPRVYESEWEGWGEFLPKSEIEAKRQTGFLTYTQAKMAARKLKLKGAMEYRYHYKNVPGLPSHPWEYYKKYWKGWADFLGK